MSEYTAVSLFAGVGGFDLALERAGVKVCASVEIDKKARGVLEHRFPNTVLFEDVRKVTGDELRATGFTPERGIICGGFPCQDLSVAGKRAGLAGERSGLYGEILRLVDELRPKWVVLENVPGLLSSNGGRDMGTVIGTLVERGYGIGYRVLDSQYFGIPQRRRRVFIIGCLGSTGEEPGKVLAIPQGLPGDPDTGFKTGQTVATGTGTGVNGTVPVLITMREGKPGGGKGPLISENKSLTLSTGNNQVLYQPQVFVKSKRPQNDQDDENWKTDAPHPTLNQFDQGDSRTVAIVVETVLNRMTAFGSYANDDRTTSTQTARQYKDATDLVTQLGRVRRLTPLEAERLQGFPDGWTSHTVDPKKGLVEQTDSSRYKQMGNAVAVPVVEWIIGRLMDHENGIL